MQAETLEFLERQRAKGKLSPKMTALLFNAKRRAALEKIADGPDEGDLRSENETHSGSTETGEFMSK